MILEQNRKCFQKEWSLKGHTSNIMADTQKHWFILIVFTFEDSNKNDVKNENEHRSPEENWPPNRIFCWFPPEFVESFQRQSHKVFKTYSFHRLVESLKLRFKPFVSIFNKILTKKTFAETTSVVRLKCSIKFEINTIFILSILVKLLIIYNQF